MIRFLRDILTVEYSCCSFRDVKRTLVKIEDTIIGIAGLDQIFEKLYTSKKSPDDVDGMEMVYLASFYNYIPNGKVEVYAEALIKEYRQFYSDMEEVEA
ncbi:hypothetical protein C5S42_01685 [Candidatus Methanomarinus sp.]|nr:hypothetical protein C5S42_01685 [ANME-2 cluster archaeon]